jgi:hypothetical protein
MRIQSRGQPLLRLRLSLPTLLQALLALLHALLALGAALLDDLLLLRRQYRKDLLLELLAQRLDLLLLGFAEVQAAELTAVRAESTTTGTTAAGTLCERGADGNQQRDDHGNRRHDTNIANHE